MNACNEERLSRHLDHELESAEARELVDHLKTCTACREAFARMKKFHALASETFPTKQFATPKTPARSRRGLAMLAAAAVLLLVLGGLGTSAMRGWFGDGGGVEEIAGTDLPRAKVDTPTPGQIADETGTATKRTSIFDQGARSGTAREQRGRTAARPDGSRLTGVIQNFDGKPVANAKVVIVHYERGSGGQTTLAAGESAVTGAEGRYNLAYPKPGTALHVYADGYAPTVLGMSQSIDVPERSINIRLFRPHMALGRVVDVQGQPIEGAMVRGGRDGSHLEEYEQYATTDREGRYSAPLSYRSSGLQVTHAGYSKATPSVRLDGIADDAVLLRGGALRVKVMREGKPFEGAAVNVKGAEDRNITSFACTDNEGFVLLDGLPVNTALSVAASWGKTSISGGLVEVSEGGTTEVTITLPAPRPEPVAVASNGGDVGGAAGRAARAANYPAIALLNASGEPLTRVLIESAILPRGQGVSFWIGNAEGPLEIRSGRHYFSVYDPVSEMGAFSQGIDVANASIVLNTPMGRITGRVVDQNGLPLAHVYIRASNSSRERKPFRYREVQSDGNGNFEVGPLTVGDPHAVQPMLPGYQMVPGAALPTAEPTRHANPITITMAKVESEISGYVVAQDGTGVPGARVSLQDGMRYVDSRTTDAAGAFRFRIASGEYEIEARARNEITGPDEAYVTAPARGVIVELPLHTGSPEESGPPVGPEHQLAQNMLKQMGVVFKMFANESQRTLFPALSTEFGKFQPVTESIYPEYLTDPAILARVTGGDTVDWVYFGYAVNNTTIGLAWLDEYERLGPEEMSGNDIDVSAKVGASGNRLFRLREGIERFFITDINNPRASAAAQAAIPLTWEMPGGHDESGGWVLYLDGHVEWKGYPGDFPMNPEFIERIRGIMNSAR